MKKNNIIILFMAFLIFASCSKDEAIPEDSSNDVVNINKDPLKPSEINAAIDNAIETKGAFNWKETSSHFLWSATFHGNHVVSIGYGKSQNDFDKTKSPQSDSMKDQLLRVIMDSEQLSLDKILINDDQYLNTMDVMIVKQETIMALRKHRFIRYIEPGDYKYFTVASELDRNTESSSSGGSGCGFESTALSSTDYTTITPNAKAGWTLYQHNIPSAWSHSTGAGITIGIVDTGVSPNQTLLGNNFNNGLSSGRTIQKFGTYVDSIWPWSTTTDGPNDQCGHGTSMSATAAAPRNDTGMPVGVAYNSSLIVYRAAANVVLDGSHEQNGVKNALTALGNNNNVRIISMSMGHIFSVGKIQDGIRYAYNRSKLIFCAGGTSFSFTTFVGVIFPASMAETVAVTGVKEGVFQKCDDCHSGSKIEFTVVMERAVTENHSPVVGYYDNQTDYVGGSSVATATTAGIAALVWAKNPTWTRSQVLTKMRQSGNFYPNRHGQFGYGNVNALLAVQ